MPTNEHAGSAGAVSAASRGAPTFSVGYRVLCAEAGCFSDIVRDFRNHIDEVYFAWPGDASGRAPLAPETADQVRWELERIRSLGVPLHLLLNASCYGGQALSPALVERVRSQVAELVDRVGLRGVTTLSPLIARTVKAEFPDVKVRASVNMRLGTVRSMAYVARWFDEYCVQREYNRHPARLAALQDWAADNGKALYVLANSGCLNFCSAQTFHDNAVAHEDEINSGPTVGGLTTLCREYYSDSGHWINLLQGSSWLRPEDIAAHRRIFSGGYKLATRLHDDPRRVIGAYARACFRGNLPDLLEPGFGPLLYPHIIDNSRFPSDWFERTTACGECCDCGYCATVLERVLVNVNGPWNALDNRAQPCRDCAQPHAIGCAGNCLPNQCSGRINKE